MEEVPGDLKLGMHELLTSGLNDYFGTQGNSMDIQ